MGLDLNVLKITEKFYKKNSYICSKLNAFYRNSIPKKCHLKQIYIYIFGLILCVLSNILHQINL